RPRAAGEGAKQNSNPGNADPATRSYTPWATPKGPRSGQPPARFIEQRDVGMTLRWLAAEKWPGGAGVQRPWEGNPPEGNEYAQVKTCPVRHGRHWKKRDRDSFTGTQAAPAPRPAARALQVSAERVGLCPLGWKRTGVGVGGGFLRAQQRTKAMKKIHSNR